MRPSYFGSRESNNASAPPFLPYPIPPTSSSGTPPKKQIPSNRGARAVDIDPRATKVECVVGVHDEMHHVVSGEPVTKIRGGNSGESWPMDTNLAAMPGVSKQGSSLSRC
jgi:hypothetical protein